MHRYPIKLTMKNDSVIEGIAVDMQLDDNRSECIKINTDGTILVVLSDVATLEVLIENKHFTSMSFI